MLQLLSYAALTGLSASSGYLAHNAVFCVLGKEAPGDGAFGRWRYDATSAATPDGGTILAHDSGLGRFFREITVPGTVSTSFWNGNASEIGAAYASAWARIKALGGGTIEIPPAPIIPGYYTWTITPGGVGIEDASPVAVTVRGIGQPYIYLIGAGSTGHKLGDFTAPFTLNNAFLLFKGFSLFDCNRNAAYGFDCSYLGNIRWEDGRTFGFSTGGHKLSHCYTFGASEWSNSADPTAATQGDGWIIEDAAGNASKFDQCKMCGYRQGKAGIRLIGASFGPIIQNCDFDDNIDHIILQDSASGFPGGVRIKDNYFETYAQSNGAAFAAAGVGPYAVAKPFDFPQDLHVVQTVGGVETVLTLDVHYTVSGGAGSTGAVTLINGLSGADGLYIGYFGYAVKVVGSQPGGIVSFKDNECLNVRAMVDNPTVTWHDDELTFGWNGKGAPLIIVANARNWRAGKHHAPAGAAYAYPGASDEYVPPEWVAFTPAWTCATTNPLIGGGTLAARYMESGEDTVDVEYLLEAAPDASTNFGAGAFRFELPFPAKNVSVNKVWTNGNGWCFDISNLMQPWKFSFQPIVYNSGAFVTLRNASDGSPVTATSPMPWASNDRLGLSVRYQRAN